MAGDDAEQVNQPLGRGTDVRADFVAAGGGIKDGEVNVGVGVGGVEETAERDGGRRFPEGEDAMDVEEVVEEGAVLVPALAGVDGTEERDEGGEGGVDEGDVAGEERAGGVQ